jgi:alkenylglycerophosphocholine/alkenylglycerophosphoethanolamine hydrolase
VMAIAGVETRRQMLVNIGKPAATIALLLIVGIPPQNSFGWLIAAGIIFSLLGDIFLLSDGDREFLIAVPLVLIAHVLYSVAFFRVMAPSGLWPPPAPAYFVVTLTVILVSLLWPGLGAMKLPVLVYGTAITVMVVSALATVGGPLPPAAALLAAAGAFTFYVSDSTLAWNRFKRPYPHAGLVTLSTYWIGQIGIALSARWYP